MYTADDVDLRISMIILLATITFTMSPNLHFQQKY